MAQEFFTVRGKVIVERDKLFIRSLVRPPLSETHLFRIALGVAAIVLFVSCFFIDDPWQRYTKIVLSVFLLARWVLPLFKLVTKMSLANRIPFTRVAHFSIHSLTTGLETVLALHLHNGRSREIVFRTRENEYAGLAEVLRAQGIPLLAGVEQGELIRA